MPDYTDDEKQHRREIAANYGRTALERAAKYANRLKRDHIPYDIHDIESDALQFVKEVVDRLSQNICTLRKVAEQVGRLDRDEGEPSDHHQKNSLLKRLYSRLKQEQKRRCKRDEKERADRLVTNLPEGGWKEMAGDAGDNREEQLKEALDEIDEFVRIETGEGLRPRQMLILMKIFRMRYQEGEVLEDVLSDCELDWWNNGMKQLMECWAAKGREINYGRIRDANEEDE